MTPDGLPRGNNTPEPPVAGFRADQPSARVHMAKLFTLTKVDMGVPAVLRSGPDERPALSRAIDKLTDDRMKSAAKAKFKIFFRFFISISPLFFCASQGLP